MPAYRVKDGQTVPDAEAFDERGCLRDGFAIGFAHAFRDSAARFSLRDAAGQPVKLVDTDTGLPVTINADLITAIESEAAKLNLSVERYLAEVLRYSVAGQALAGNPN